MNHENIKPIIGKYIFKGKIVLKTGTRIGGLDTGISIGGIENVVIRNPLNGEPYIPGSSLKGKMRCLLERLKRVNLKECGQGKSMVRRHECDNVECEICRLFGSSPKTEEEGKVNIPARIIVRDAHLTPESKESLEGMETDLPYTEWKMENALDRITCHASPRSFERVPAGAEFELEIIYTADREDHIQADLNNIVTALELIEDDYIGSSGSRGYGKVSFTIEEFIVKSEGYYKGQVKEFSHKKLQKKDLSDLKEVISSVFSKPRG